MTRACVVLLTLACMCCASPLRTLYRDTITTPWEQAKYAPPTRNDCPEALALMESRASTLKLTVTYGPLPEQMVGLFSRDDKAISVLESLSVCGRFEVLAHELGHAIGPHQIAGSAEGQVFADAVAYLVVKELAPYDPTHTFASYLASMKHASPTMLIYQTDIERAASWLVYGEVRPWR